MIIRVYGIKKGGRNPSVDWYLLQRCKTIQIEGHSDQIKSALKVIYKQQQISSEMTTSGNRWDAGYITKDSSSPVRMLRPERT